MFPLYEPFCVFLFLWLIVAFSFFINVFVCGLGIEVMVVCSCLWFYLNMGVEMMTKLLCGIYYLHIAFTNLENPE